MLSLHHAPRTYIHRPDPFQAFSSFSFSFALQQASKHRIAAQCTAACTHLDRDIWLPFQQQPRLVSSRLACRCSDHRPPADLPYLSSFTFPSPPPTPPPPHYSTVPLIPNLVVSRPLFLSLTHIITFPCLYTLLQYCVPSATLFLSLLDRQGYHRPLDHDLTTALLFNFYPRGPGISLVGSKYGFPELKHPHVALYFPQPQLYCSIESDSILASGLYKIL